MATFGAALASFALLLPMVLPSAFSQTPTHDSVRLAFVGDVLPHKLVRATARARRRTADEGYSALVAAIAPQIRTYDLAFFNMESPVLSNPRLPPSKMRFWAPPALPTALAHAGFDVAGCANNHAFDQGREATVTTRENLQHAGLRAIGCGDEADAARPEVIMLRGIRIAFVAFTAVLNSDIERVTSGATALLWQNDGSHVIEVLRAARASADYVVAFAHWGSEYTPRPSQRTRAIARAVIDAGADLIVGHHPHVLQPAETWHATDGRVATVIFSLGNFISEMCGGNSLDSLCDTRLAALAEVTLTRHGLRVDTAINFVPVWMRHDHERCSHEDPASHRGLCVEPMLLDNTGHSGESRERSAVADPRRAELVRAFMGPHAEERSPHELFETAREIRRNSPRRFR